jgi:alkanesulfonate monooxygenase SsuD/methylene tetrahydromethanopterin reductase-like flavin-dependent oxidoreductase (luciferase family)
LAQPANAFYVPRFRMLSGGTRGLIGTAIQPKVSPNKISEIASEVGRDPATLKRSACLLVITDASAGERPAPTTYTAATLSDIRQRVIEMRDAGADEVILVSDPINERSVRVLAEALR